MTDDFSHSLGTDFYQLEDRLTGEERALRGKVRAFTDVEIIPGSTSTGRRRRPWAELQMQGRLTGPMASMAKMHNARKARAVCAQARDVLGGNGLLLGYHVARHLTDMELVHTYEGTESVQSLILGREITGLSAFA